MVKKNTTPVPETNPGYPKMADTRLEQIRFTLEDQKIDALVVNYIPNIRYLTNFSGSDATLFITKDELHFVTDDRYEEQIQTELYPLPNLHTHISRNPWSLIKEGKVLKKISSLAFESDRMYYSDAVTNRNIIRPIKFKPLQCVVEPFTVPKAPEELVFIEKACEIAEATYQKILEFVKPGVSEKEIANEISYQSRLLGSEGDAFDIIVVSGVRGPIIHGKPSEKKIHKNELILIDFGCIHNGFMCDISRTFAVGKATKEQRAIYKLLYDAKENAIANIRPGMKGETVDRFSRSMISKAGYGDYFQHSLGHGIGVVPHEMPLLTFRRDDQTVPLGSVLAIEPGVYLPGKFGIRIEDMILVTRKGGKHLTNAPDDIIVI